MRAVESRGLGVNLGKRRGDGPLQNQWPSRAFARPYFVGVVASAHWVQVQEVRAALLCVLEELFDKRDARKRETRALPGNTEQNTVNGIIGRRIFSPIHPLRFWVRARFRHVGCTT